MINAQVCDLIDTTRANLERVRPECLGDVHAAEPLVGFSEPMQSAQVELKRFLHANLYRHYQVMRMTAKAQRVVGDLFAAFSTDPRLLPPTFRSEDEQARRIADYIAGMTDRYAMREYRRLFAVDEA